MCYDACVASRSVRVKISSVRELFASYKGTYKEKPLPNNILHKSREGRSRLGSQFLVIHLEYRQGFPQYPILSTEVSNNGWSLSILI